MALFDELFDESTLRASATSLHKKMLWNAATAPCLGRDAVIKAHQSCFLHFLNFFQTVLQKVEVNTQYYNSTAMLKFLLFILLHKES